MEEWKLEPAKDLDLPPGKRARSHLRENGLLETVVQLAWWSGVCCYLRLAHRLRIEGREHLPAEAPFVLIANHASHLDALSLAAALPARLRAVTFPIAAGDTFFETPSASFFAAFVLNALPMWRRNCGRHAMQELRTRLAEGACAFIVFPEGTRSRSGERGPFKPGLGMLVAGSAVPVVPCLLAGTHRAWPPQRRLPRPRRVALRIGQPLTFEDLPNEREGWRHVARRAERAIDDLVPAG